MSFDPFLITKVLLAGAILIQDLELLALRKNFADAGIWSWQILRRDFTKSPVIIRIICNTFFSNQAFLGVIALRLTAALSLSFIQGVAPLIILWLCSLLIAVRFRGIFNGGSDYMTLVILNGLVAQQLFPESEVVALGALYYIAIQSSASYMISGVVKLRSKNWREGRALAAFIHCGAFPAPAWFLAISNDLRLMRILSWGLIGFECLFPLAFLAPECAGVFLISGAIFHLVNAYLLGLNRFFHIWVATYPAILWCVG